MLIEVQISMARGSIDEVGNNSDLAPFIPLSLWQDVIHLR
jgi:hypothetical protein